MIKQINYQNILTTPFVAKKAWELYNVDNNDLVLTEINTVESASAITIGSIPVALDYLYYVTTPLLNRDCNIALEQQSDDLAGYEEGISGSGIFYPNIESQNQDGTYKRLVYDQVYRAFYNNYLNPLQIFGMENIDFPLSQTKRFLAEYFRMFTVPQNIFGDKLVEGTIQLYDNTLDDTVIVTDDYNGNLLAGWNLFSKVQEVRTFGGFQNILIDGSSSYICGWMPPEVVVSGGDLSGSLVSVGFLYGSLNTPLPFSNSADFSLTFYTGSLTNTVLTTSGSGESGSYSVTFYSGSLDSVVLIRSGSSTGSYSVGFYTGSLDTVVLLASGSGESGSVGISFISGSTALNVSIAYHKESGSILVGFLSGALA